jgi:hypothetical protein
MPAPAPSWPHIDPWVTAAAPPSSVEWAAIGSAAHHANRSSSAQAAAANPLLRVLVSHIKLHDLSPCELPRELASLVRNWLGPHVLDALAYVRPGCTLLTVHALVPMEEAEAEAEAEEEGGTGSAAALAAALAALAPGRVARSRIDVHDARGGVARARDGAVVVTQAAGGAAAAAASSAAAPLPPLRPLALCSAQAGALSSSASAPARATGCLRAYCSGVLLPLPREAERVAAGQAITLQLPATGCAQKDKLGMASVD